MREKLSVTWRFKVTLSIVCAIAFAIVATWILNITLLDWYYQRSKLSSIEQAYVSVKEMLTRYTEETESTENGFLTDEDAMELMAISARDDMDIYILKGWDTSYYFSTANSYSKKMVFLERLKEYVLDDNKRPKRDENLKTDIENGYVINKVYDMKTDDFYIELYSGGVDEGDFILIRSSIESMKNSADISSRFLLMVGIIVICIVSFVMGFVTKRFIRPIRELSSIAKDMSNLNFDRKYTGCDMDEIGELGQSINIMSQKLEQTISDLKSANNALQSDIEQKVQVDEMRKEFLSNVTHELKTPIALISGYAEGLKDCINDDAESREYYCDVIIDEAGKMNTMVKKLLTLNHIEFGSQVVEFERFDCSEMMKSVIQKSEVLLESKGITIYQHFEDSIFAWADEYMIEEVFTNYLTNAINHCENEMVIDVKAEKRDNLLRISVFNTGAPIPEEDVDKVWIKFYKVDKARTRAYGGSGIGLSIVKAIMESHNRDYGLINHANGVEFWFEIDCNN